MITAITQYTLVSPVPEASRYKVWEWLNFYAHQTLDTASPQSLDDFLRKDELDRLNGGKTYGILRHVHLVGAVWFENAGDNIGLGHLVFDPSRDIERISRADKVENVTKAIHESGFRKIVWSFYADNTPFRLFLERCGASHEGLLRKHVHRGKELVDVTLMASFPEGR